MPRTRRCQECGTEMERSLTAFMYVCPCCGHKEAPFEVERKCKDGIDLLEFDGVDIVIED